MKVLEVLALVIVVIFVAVRSKWGPKPRAFLIRLALLVVASWVAEDTCIRLYGFYFYNPDWSLFIDRVPLAIVLIWPVVIHSAWELARCLEGRAAASRETSSRATTIGRIPLLGAALVLADASMIEPIAVNSGLWTWTEPGVFDVPPIGIIGWAYYAGFCMLVFEWIETRKLSPQTNAVVIVIAPVGAHLLLLASWWGFFRWVNRPLSAWPFVGVAWTLALLLTLQSARTLMRDRVPRRDMLNRIPAALFFFALLAVDAHDVPPLILYALAFAPPYLSLVRWKTGVRPRSAPRQNSA